MKEMNAMHDDASKALGDSPDVRTPLRGRTGGFRTILNAVPAAIYVAHDPDGRRVTRSRAACDLLRPSVGTGLAAGPAPPSQAACFRVFQGGQELAFPEALIRRAARGDELQRVELGVAFDNGLVRHIYGNVAPLLDEQGRPRGAVAVFMDITELKRAHEAMVAEVQELARSNSELEQFAAVAAHDLRSPLQSLVGCVQVLCDEHLASLPPEVRELLGHVRAGAWHMTRLITGLLDYARAGHGDVKIRLCDANHALRVAVTNLRSGLEATGGCVTSDTLPVLPADESLLSQLLQNLIENAVTYRGEAPPHVHVSAEESPRSWTFSVRDNGVGIAPEHRDRIFRAFERLPSAGAIHRGLGIGLTTCSRIVERHHGRIWVQSQPGAGATFFFTIPRQHGDPAGAAPRGAAGKTF